MLIETKKDPELFMCMLCLFHQNLFEVESVNCICVDWKGGSRTTYPQATQNIQVVGAEVAYLVDFLQVTTSRFCKSPCTLPSGFFFPKHL